jgi:hypothetical protein
MVCPNCNSTHLGKLSLIYAAGVYESRGRIGGLFLGGGDDLLFGKHSGTSQSRLSRLVGPPRKAPYTAPVILWLLCFFIVMAFAGRGKLSALLAIVSAVGYVFLLPALLIGTFIYNFVVYQKTYRNWDLRFLCQCCGSTSVASTNVGSTRHSCY